MLLACPWERAMVLVRGRGRGVGRDWGHRFGVVKKQLRRTSWGGMVGWTGAW